MMRAEKPNYLYLIPIGETSVMLPLVTEGAELTIHFRVAVTLFFGPPSVSSFRGDEREKKKEEFLVSLGNHTTFLFLRDFRDFNLMLLLSNLERLSSREHFQKTSSLKTTSGTQIISGACQLFAVPGFDVSSNHQKKTITFVTTDHRLERLPGFVI